MHVAKAWPHCTAAEAMMNQASPITLLSGNIQAREQATDGTEVKGAARQEEVAESKKPEDKDVQGKRGTNVIDLRIHRRG